MVDRYRVSAILNQSSIDRTVRLEKPSAEHHNPRELAPARPPVLLCDVRCEKKSESCSSLGFRILLRFLLRFLLRVLLDMDSCSLGACFLLRFLLPGRAACSLPAAANPPSEGMTP